MLSKCANPDCSESFIYLRKGKLFRLDAAKISVSPTETNGAPDVKKPVRKVEFFWLCDGCSSKMTLIVRKGVGITTKPLALSQKAGS